MKQKGSKGQSKVVRRRRVIRQTSHHQDMPERSNKGGEVLGKDRAAEVRGMNDHNGLGKADARKGGGKIRVKKGKGKRRKKR